MNKKIRIFYILVFIFTLITLIFTFPVITKMTTSIYGPIYGTDYRGAIRHCWWVGYAFKHRLNWRIDNMVNYPFGQTYDLPIISPLWQIIAYPLSSIFNELFAFNFIFILSFILSAITMFFLVFYITKDYQCSFLAGLIYSFCPYHFNKIWEHLGIALIEWMPIYVLYLLRLRGHRKFKDIILCSIAFSLVIFSDYYYAFFMAIVTLGFITYLLFYQWKIKFHSMFKGKNLELKRLFKEDFKIIQRVIMAMVFTFLLTLPATFNIFKTMIFNTQAKSAVVQGFVRSFNYLFSQAALPLNYVIPASAHPIFGSFTKSLFGSIFYGRGSIEQTLFLGYIPLFLTFISYRAWSKSRLKVINKVDKVSKQDNFIVGFFIFLAILAFLFSMPPYFNFLFFKIYFPPYFTYKFFPMFRAYARFGIIVMLAISVLAGIGLKNILLTIKLPNKRFVLTLALSFFILFEFNNIPSFRVADVSHPPGVYKWLKEQNGDSVIAEYPLDEGGGEGGETYVDLDYLFYQRVHQKRMINGALPGTSAYLIRNKITKITNPQTAGILKSLGVKYVVIHLNKYKSSAYSEAMEIKGDLPDLSRNRGLKLISKFGDDEVYEVIAKNK